MKRLSLPKPAPDQAQTSPEPVKSRSNLPADPKTAAALILDRYEQGESMFAIAKALGISHQAIYSRLLSTDLELYKARQSAQALADLETAQSKLDQATSMVEVSKNRELASLYKWKLERLLPAIFGQQQPGQASQGIHLYIGIERADSGLVIEQQPNGADLRRQELSLGLSQDEAEQRRQGLALAHVQD